MGHETKAGLVLFILMAMTFNLNAAGESIFIGDWKIEIEKRGRIADGLLELRASDNKMIGHVEGGPIGLRINGSKIEMDIDGLTAGGGTLVRNLKGTLKGDVMEGRFGPEKPPEVCVKYPLQCHTPSGTWKATRIVKTEIKVAGQRPGDLSGVWQSVAGGGLGKYSMDVTPKAQEWVDNFRLDMDLPAFRCVKAGLFTRFAASSMEILPGKNRLTFLYSGGEIRRVYLDGRKPDEYALNTAMGFSTAKWEGSTLVVETTLLRQANIGFRGEPISENARIVERYTLGDDGNTMSGVMTLNDPENYLKPPLRRKTWKRNPKGDITTVPECDPDSFFRELYTRGQMQEYIDRADRRY